MSIAIALWVYMDGVAIRKKVLKTDSQKILHGFTKSLFECRNTGSVIRQEECQERNLALWNEIVIDDECSIGIVATGVADCLSRGLYVVKTDELGFLTMNNSIAI